MAAYRAFREPMLVTEPLDTADFDDFDARRLRYALYWSFYENNAYRALHTWSHTYKIQFGLYRYTRGIYNPAYRLATFWQTHLMGGTLDPEAGDGEQEPSCLPIVTDNEALRPVIASLWERSRWQVNKDVMTLHGTAFGDVGLQVVDDPVRETVYLQIVNPSTIRDVTYDPFGNVRAYVFEEDVAHPENPSRTVTYRETADRDGEMVVYRTFLNDQPYAWPGQNDEQGNPRAEWAEPYGFIPLVMIQHNDVGLDWGWSEMHPGRAKFQEVDDQASKLNDQVRKMVEGAWLFTGVDNPSSTPTATSRDSETYQTSSSAVDRPQPGREEMVALYGPLGADVKSLIAPLDIAAVGESIQRQIEELERDFPELRADIQSASGDASGRALRVARQQAEAKVRMRRTNYDRAVISAQQMAISIGGMRGYEGFQGFSLDSYQRGDLEHHFGKRVVFAADPLDDHELTQAEWEAAKAAVAAGLPLRLFLQRQGWNEEELAEFDQQKEAQANMGIERAPADWNVRNDDSEDDESPD